VVAESSDVDGDLIEYRFAWTVDGAPYIGASDGATESVVDGGAVGGSERWSCAVVANDGREDGPAGEAEVLTLEGCADPAVSDGWVCGDALVAASDVWTRTGYTGDWTLGEWAAGDADPVGAPSDRALECGEESWRLNDGTTQILVSPTSVDLSCDGVYDVTLVGRINTQFQRGLTLHVYFGDPTAPTTPYVWMDRWTWNWEGEAGANSGLSTGEELLYNYRLDWYGMPSSAEWFDIRIEVDTVNDSCTTTFTSDSHVRAHTFDCVLPDDVPPTIGVVSWGPMEDRGGSPDADIIGVYASPALRF
jgi:hypothetical protein